MVAQPDSSGPVRSELPYDTRGVSPEQTWIAALQDSGSHPGSPDSGGEYSTVCPAHDDRKASLRWRVAEDGRVLIHCHAGCEFGDILESVGLEAYQLKWLNTDYYYTDRVGNPVFRVRRTQGADDGKDFAQYHWEPETSEWVKGRNHTPDFLWRMDQLLDWARANVETSPAVLWLVEGEKDVIVMAPWVEPAEFVTTGPGGAAKWSPTLTQQLVEVAALVPGLQIRVLGDNDRAGYQKVKSLTHELTEVGLTVNPWHIEGEYTDIAHLIDRTRTQFRDFLSPGLGSTPTAVEGTLATGFIARSPTGHLLRQRGNTITEVTMYPFDVTSEMLDENGNPSGWSVTWEDHRGTQVALLRRLDLVGSRDFGKWNASVGGPMLKCLPEISAWLQWRVVDRNLPSLQPLPVGMSVINGVPVLIGTDGTTLWSQDDLDVRVAADPAPERYLTGQASAREAVTTLAKVLQFRPIEESGPLVSALVASCLSPSIQQICGNAPRLITVSGRSGSGKTSFLRLAMRLVGFTGAGAMATTEAGLARLIGPALPYWIDDVDDDESSRRLISRLRGWITGGTRVKADRDSDQRVIEQQMRSPVVFSFEGDLMSQDRATRDRRVHVDLVAQVDDRTRADGRPQWLDMVELGASPSSGDPLIVASVAGRLLAEVAQRLGRPHERSDEWAAGVGTRGIAATWAVDVASAAMARLLAEYGFEDLAAELDRAVGQWAQQTVEQHRQAMFTHSDSLLWSVLKSYVQASRSGGPTPPMKVATAVSASETDIRKAIKEAWGPPVLSGHKVLAPTVVALEVPGKDPALAVQTDALAAWIVGEGGARARVGEALKGRAMTMQDLGNHMRDVGAVKVRVLNRPMNPTYRVVPMPPAVAEMLGWGSRDDD